MLPLRSCGRLSQLRPSVSSRFHSDCVRVRFAPSPTGNLHLGGLRTALYNYLFARKHNGKFILRIEDTDQTRKVPGSVEQIHKILDQYDLKVDEGPRVGGPYGPYEQSHRLHLYKDQAERLISSGHAYRCFCSEQRLEILRKNAARNNTIPKYDKKCRSVSTEESEQRVRNGEPYVVRFKMDKMTIPFEVFGPITQVLDESDMIILKSDGYPTYHLANVVDDSDMKISHVIRGMEWLSSTGKHASLYRAFDRKPPKWVHLPLITRDGKKKLSKRDKDSFVEYYAYVLAKTDCFHIRNGSGIRDFESDRLYSLEDMISSFAPEYLGKRNLQLDEDVLRRLSRMAFRQTPSTLLVSLVREKLSPEFNRIQHSDEYLLKVIDFLKSNEERFTYLSELINGSFSWFFNQPSSIEKILSVFDKEQTIRALNEMSNSDSWTNDSMKTVASKCDISFPKFLQLLRLAMIDSKSGPPMQELVSFFGVTECKARIEKMISLLNAESC